MEGVFTITANGRLMKPQVLKNGKLEDWLTIVNNTSIGSSNKVDKNYSDGTTTIISRYEKNENWTNLGESDKPNYKEKGLKPGISSN
jgi:hypothetical protein